jgi:hypothetical protein
MDRVLKRDLFLNILVILFTVYPATKGQRLVQVVHISPAIKKLVLNFKISSTSLEMYLCFVQYMITFVPVLSNYKCGCYFNNLFIVF